MKEWLKKFLNPSSANTAKNRLRIVIAQERASGTEDQPDFLPLLHREILKLIEKYTEVSPADVEVDVTTHQDNSAVLKLNVVLAKTKKEKAKATAVV